MGLFGIFETRYLCFVVVLFSVFKFNCSCSTLYPVLDVKPASLEEGFLPSVFPLKMVMLVSLNIILENILLCHVVSIH